MDRILNNQLCFKLHETRNFLPDEYLMVLGVYMDPKNPSKVKYTDMVFWDESDGSVQWKLWDEGYTINAEAPNFWAETSSAKIRIDDNA